MSVDEKLVIVIDPLLTQDFVGWAYDQAMRNIQGDYRNYRKNLRMQLASLNSIDLSIYIMEPNYYWDLLIKKFPREDLSKLWNKINNTKITKELINLVLEPPSEILWLRGELQKNNFKALAIVIAAGEGLDVSMAMASLVETERQKRENTYLLHYHYSLGKASHYLENRSAC